MRARVPCAQTFARTFKTKKPSGHNHPFNPKILPSRSAHLVSRTDPISMRKSGDQLEIFSSVPGTDDMASKKWPFFTKFKTRFSKAFFVFEHVVGPVFATFGPTHSLNGLFCSCLPLWLVKPKHNRITFTKTTTITTTETASHQIKDQHNLVAMCSWS